MMFDFEVGAWGAPWEWERSVNVCGFGHHDAIYHFHLLCRARILWAWFNVLIPIPRFQPLFNSVFSFLPGYLVPGGMFRIPFSSPFFFFFFFLFSFKFFKWGQVDNSQQTNYQMTDMI
jgi:hypothetical protein